MRLIKSSTTNTRSILGDGLKHDTRTRVTVLDGTVMLAPQGTTDERPVGVDGYVRFNLDYGSLEYFWDGEWRIVGSGGGGEGSIVVETFYSGFQKFDTLFGPLDPKDPAYFVIAAADRTLVFVEELYQSPFVDYDIVTDPLEIGIGAEVAPNEVVNGKEYLILDAGNTNWTAIGSTDNNQLTKFVASYTTTVVPPITVTNPNVAVTGDQFGYAIDSSPTYMVVGSPLEDDAGETDVGAVYVYNHSGGLIQKVVNPRSYATAQDDQFGFSVAINSSTYLAVGAYREDDAVSGGNRSGKAYLYSLTAMTGAPTYTLSNPDVTIGDAEDHFGYSVALSETHLIVGAPSADDAGIGTPSGKAYIYDLSDPTKAPIVLSNLVDYASGGTSFGETVGINDVYAIVGAPQQNTAYVFEVETGDLLYIIENPNATAADLFASSIDMSDTYVIIGAPGTAGALGGSNSGRAYIYAIKSHQPTDPVYVLDNPNLYMPDTDDYFGQNVAVSDNFAVISAHMEDDVGVNNTGRAYVYDLADGSLLEVLTNPNASGTSDDDNYGTAVSALNDRVIVGAHNEDNGATTSTGALYSSQITGKGTGDGVCREVGSYVKFTQPLNTAPVLKTREADGSVKIDFDFQVNNLKITLVYNVSTALAGLSLADKWTFARTITLDGHAVGSVAIDGASDVTLNVQVLNDSHTHDGRYYTESEIDLLLADKANINGDIAVDFSTNQLTANNITSIGPMTGDLIGNADTASALQNPFTLTIDGDVVGSVSLDGSSDVTLTAEIIQADTWETARTITLAGDATGSVTIDGSSDETLTVAIPNKADINGDAAQPFSASLLDAPTVQTDVVEINTDWTIQMSGTSLRFIYQGTPVAQIDSDGTIKSASDIISDETL